MKRKTVVYTAFSQVVLTCILSSVAFAQPIPPDPTTPLGSGLVMLLGAGIVYGVLRFFKSNKK